MIVLVRAFFFATEADAFIGTMEDSDEEGLNANAASFCFIWTYPLINFIVASYTISSHWCYDLMVLMHGNQGIWALRRQMNVFVIAIVIFVVVIYLIYMLSLPQTTVVEQINQLFFYMAIFEWLTAAILLISMFLYLKRIMNSNRIYGKMVWVEAITFTCSNTFAGFFNYFLYKNDDL